MHPNFSIEAVFISKEQNLYGNTAAVVHLNKSISDVKMQHIASDFNQPATTFLWSEENKYFVRWFAPDAEIGLCGHGSLAAFSYLDSNEQLTLHYPGGKIQGWKNEDCTFSMRLDSIPSIDAGEPDEFIKEGISQSIEAYFSNENKNIVLLKNEEAVRRAKPDFFILKNMHPFGIILTAPGNEVDFVSRTLVPKVQQLEDHATGSSHAALTPFWAKKLNKITMTAYQLSPRGGKFVCTLENDQVILTGECKKISSGILAG